MRRARTSSAPKRRAVWPARPWETAAQRGGCWCRESGAFRPLSTLAVALRPDLFDGVINHLLEFVRGNVGESCTCFADSLMKDAPADSLLDEFREVTFLHALRTQKSSQRMIGFLGPGNSQTSSFRFGCGIISHISVYPLIIIDDYTISDNEWPSPWARTNYGAFGC